MAETQCFTSADLKDVTTKGSAVLIISPPADPLGLSLHLDHLQRVTQSGSEKIKTDRGVLVTTCITLLGLSCLQTVCSQRRWRSVRKVAAFF